MMTRLLTFALLAVTISAQERTPWTTSRITGSPETPPAYVAEPLWTDLNLDKILEIAHLPEARRIFLVAQKGTILSLPDDTRNEPESIVFAELSKSILNLTNVYGLTFQVKEGKRPAAFIFYTTENPATKEKRSHVARFKTLQEPFRIDPENREVILSLGAGGHNGGHLQFGPDGMLYISVGDLEVPSPPDPGRTGQNITDLAGSILRVDVDNRDPGLAYRIPADNPFIKTPGARHEVWAFGLRNPWKMCFHPKTNDLLVGDVGWESWELLHKIERGGNYGWSLVEGPKAINVDHPSGPGKIRPPVIAYSHYEGASITGGYVYQGKRLPKLNGAYIYGDFVTGRIWAMRHDGKKLLNNRMIADTRQRIVTFGQAANGEILFINWPKQQTLFRLAPNPKAGTVPNFPKTLSKTGLFADAPEEKPAPGVYKFQPITPMWQDGATASHYLAIPGKSTIQTEIHKRRGSLLLRYNKPRDTALAKTIRLGGRRIETQILHFDGYWRGYTYRWNEAQTDAQLVSAKGLDATIDGKPWRFHSREECMRCHGGNFNHLYAFTPGQLNHDNQLQRFRKLQLVDDKFSSVTEAQAMADPHDKTEPIEARARSWMHINCAHCHRVSGGGSVPIYLNIETPIDQMGLIGRTPQKGHFNLDNPALIQPGRPYSSSLYFRSLSTGIGHMPMIGAKSIDKDGTKALHDWIKSLGKSPVRSQPKAPDTSSNALHLVHLLDHGQLEKKTRRHILQSAGKSQSVEIQGIFQRHLRK
jgi:glucose/arabinose dehydrogenase